MPEEPAQDKNKHEENVWRQYGRYSHLALALPAAIIAGLLLGAALDHWLKTTWITLAGLLLGCVAGFAELIRALLKMSRES